MALRSNQKAAILSLVMGGQKQEAAGIAGVHPRTMSIWLQQPEFRAELARVESELVSAAARSMAAGAKDAVDYLRGVLADPDATITEKTRAADRFLAHLPSVRILGSIEERLSRAELEQSK